MLPNPLFILDRHEKCDKQSDPGHILLHVQCLWFLDQKGGPLHSKYSRLYIHVGLFSMHLDISRNRKDQVKVVL